MASKDVVRDEEEEENIRVVARIRPLLPSEVSAGHSSAISCLEDGKTLHVIGEISLGSERTIPRSISQSYTLNTVVAPEAPQSAFFEHCGIKQLLLSSLDGFASTLFAFGQTGSGKTYSIVGPETFVDQLDQRSGEQDGILSRSMKFIFNEIKRRQETHVAQYSVETSYCEVYNEQVRDLFSPTSEVLPVKWNPHHGFYVHNITTVQSCSKAEVMRQFCRGFQRTRVSSHEMNSRSNRSHCIFTVNIHISQCESSDRDASGGGKASHVQKKHGRICFVDLAGSERQCDTRATGKVLAESGQINKSLFTLGKVIAALSDRSPGARVPYRDSTLTKLLMTSIGGNCKTLMVACCSASSAHVSETLRCLEFASRTKNIRNKPVVILDPKQSLIRELRLEIAKLRRQNRELQNTLKDGLSGSSSIATDPSNLSSIAAVARSALDEDLADRAGPPSADSQAEDPLTAYSIALKTRHILNERRRAKKSKAGNALTGSADPYAALAEKDDLVMKELQVLVHEYMCYKGHPPTNGDQHDSHHQSQLLAGGGEADEDSEGEIEFSTALRAFRRELDCVPDSKGAKPRGLGAPVTAGASAESSDSDLDFGLDAALDVASDEDETDILDVWQTDKQDALDEMRELETELAIEALDGPESQRGVVALVKRGALQRPGDPLVSLPRVRHHDPSGDCRSSTVAAREPASSAPTRLSHLPLTSGASRPKADRVPEAKVRPASATVGGVRHQAETASRRSAPLAQLDSVAAPHRRAVPQAGSAAAVQRPTSGPSKMLDSDKLREARLEVIRNTMANINGWGSARE